MKQAKKVKIMKLEEKAYSQLWGKFVDLIEKSNLPDCNESTPSEFLIFGIAHNKKTHNYQIVGLNRCRNILKFKAMEYLM